MGRAGRSHERWRLRPRRSLLLRLHGVRPSSGRGALYRLDHDRSVHRVLDAATISNGLDWSPDGSTAYYVDTEASRVDAFDYAREAGLTNRRPFAYVDPSDGRPDGLTVDSQGGVWVALNSGGAIRRYDPAGLVDLEIETPTPHVTACAFGGSDLGTLFITTSRERVEGDEDRIAGSLLATEPGVAGRPVREFTG